MTKTKTVITTVVKASKMFGMDSKGFPDIDRYGEIRIRVSSEFKPGDQIMVKYKIYRKNGGKEE